jgi:hypothetical protein
MPRAKSDKQKKRLTLDLSEKTCNALEALKLRTDADSLVEVVRKAVAVYELVIAESDMQGMVEIAGKEVYIL